MRETRIQTGANKRSVVSLSWQMLSTFVVSFLLEDARWQCTREYQFATPLDIARGFGEVPYQYRFLTPWVCLKISTSVPHVTFHSCLFITDVLASMLTVYSCHEILRLFGFSKTYAFPLSLLVVIPLALCFLISFGTEQPQFYPYDLPAVAFFTYGLLLLSTKRQLLFELLFCTATLNRETMLFLIFPYMRAFWVRKKAIVGVRIVLLLLWWAALKYFLSTVYSMNPGRPVHLDIAKNIQWLSDTPHLLYLLVVGGGMWVPLGCLWGTVPHDFRDLLACVVPFGLTVAIAGTIGEMRVFAEVSPLLWVGGLIAIRFSRYVDS
jgi:hypothetical protein